MSWKDDYREDYDNTDLTWTEYHNEKFVHVDDQNELRTEIETLHDELEAMMREYRGLKREFHELKVMLESEEFDP